ncbi:hypothetical protein CDAR_264391 [Caerostris darwini]|uniref:Uncharacterized protein n=1 Tax=Caerostris darwini TaxID=1538125 RepID=A0AAV4Q6F8_9ARAC|nr:hypothetical protein CDAR_264391 [Caerostris darwini]
MENPLHLSPTVQFSKLTPLHPLPKTVAFTISLNRTPLRSIDDDDDYNYASKDETKTISSHCQRKASSEEPFKLSKLLDGGGRPVGNNGFECSIAPADNRILTAGQKRGFAGDRGWGWFRDGNHHSCSSGSTVLGQKFQRLIWMIMGEELLSLVWRGDFA